MPPVPTIVWVALVTLLWVGVVAGVWALLSTRDEYPAEVSQPPTND